MNVNAVREAIAALPLIEGAQTDFAERMIVSVLPYMPHTGVDWQPTAKQSAEALDEFVRALRRLRTTSADVRGHAFEALNAAKHRRALTWPPADAHWSFLHSAMFNREFDKQWPDLEACAIEAASELRKSPPATPKASNSSMETFAHTLACAFNIVTGAAPAKGRGENSFSKFVAAIFAAGNLNASASHYAALGAARWHEESRDKK